MRGGCHPAGRVSSPQTGTHLRTAAPDQAPPLPALPDPRTLFGARRRVLAWLGTFVGVTAPLLGVAAAAVLLWGWGFGWVDLGLLIGMYFLTMLGVTVGFHRLFTHRSFRARRPVQVVLGILGSMTFQGPLIPWVGRHRLHHHFSDADGDPHSPRPRGRGIRGRLRGFWHAHIGWAFAPMADDVERYAGDLVRDRVLRA